MSSYSRVTINVPEVNIEYAYSRGNSFGDPHVKSSNTQMIRRIASSYGNEVNRWGRIFQIPNGVLIAFIATESGGDEDIKSFTGCCFGLMQVSPNAVLECSSKYERMTGVPLPEEVRSVLVSVVPNIMTATSLTTAQRNKIISRLKDSNFNIMCGTMILRWLLERFSTIITGAQLNKAIVAYNAGAYTRSLNSGTRPNKIPVDTASLVKNRLVPNESRQYLIKMLGENGFMSLIYKDKVI